jgi:hypothetical protein
VKKPRRNFVAESTLSAALLLAIAGVATMWGGDDASQAAAVKPVIASGQGRIDPWASSPAAEPAVLAPEAARGERPALAVGSAGQAWQLASAPRNDNGRQVFELVANPAVFQTLSAGQELSFPTPGAELRFKARLQAASDASNVGRFTAGEGRGLKVTGLNQIDGKRQTLDMALGPQRMIGSLEDGDKLYVFVLSKDGRGEMTAMPDRPAPRPLGG